MARFIVTTLLCFSLSLPGLFAREAEIPRLESSLDRDTVHIGDPIRYTLRVTAPEGVEVEFPDLEGGMVGEFEIAETGESGGREAGKEWRERFYILLGFKTGDRSLPAPSATLRYPDGREEKLEGSPLGIVVESLLEDEGDVAEQDIREIKPPLSIRANYLPLVLFAAGAVLILLLFLVFRRYFRRKEYVPPPPCMAMIAPCVHAPLGPRQRIFR